MYLHTNHTHSAVSPSLTYTGSGYAHYSLTEEGARQRRQAGGVLRSTYQDVVSLSLRTTHTDGSLFHMQDSSGSEYLYIQVIDVYIINKCADGNVVYDFCCTLPLSAGVRASGAAPESGQWAGDSASGVGASDQ